MARSSGLAGIGQALTQPQAPAAGLPTDPAELSKWAAFRQRLANDPNLRMALLTTGTNMLRTPQAGQSGFDVFADAAGTGISTLDQLRQRDLTQQTAADAQSFREGATTRQLGQGDERIDIARTGQESRTSQNEERIGIARDTLTASTGQFEAKLEESARQFDERLAAGGFAGVGGSAGSTGPERMANIAEQAFITSGIYPDTEQGKALAALRARGLVGKSLVTAQDRFDFASELASDILLFNKDISAPEAAARAQELADILGNSLNETDPATLQEEGGVDPNIGQPVSHPSRPELSGTIGPGSTPGTYKIIGADGVAGPDVDAAVIAQLLALQGNQQVGP